MIAKVCQKKKSHQKKTTPHLSWTREDRCIQRHLQLFSLLVKVSSLTNHHGFQYLISEVTCCLHPFATLVENRIYLNWKKKTIKIIEYNLSHKKFVTRVESVFWMSEWKPFPHKKKALDGSSLYQKCSYKSSRIVNYPVLSPFLYYTNLWWTNMAMENLPFEACHGDSPLPCGV